MNELLKQLPKTPQEIYASIIRGDKFGEPLDSIINMSFGNLVDMFVFLDDPDELTHEIYGDPDEDGNIIFPFVVKKPKAGVQEYRGKLGEQTSQYHKELMKDHTLLVAARLADRIDCGMMATMYAILHDCGKKYTCGTNAKGELCFYGHDIVSAYLAGAWMRNSYGTDGDSLKMTITVVFAHMLPKLDWRQKPEKREEFFRNLDGFFDAEEDKAKTEAEILIDAISESDAGCATEEEIKEHKELILKGMGLVNCLATL